MRWLQARSWTPCTVSFMAGAHICLHLLVAEDVANVLLDHSSCPLGIAADLQQTKEG